MNDPLLWASWIASLSLKLLDIAPGKEKKDMKAVHGMGSVNMSDSPD
jgi:hypothetical protein